MHIFLFFKRLVIGTSNFTALLLDLGQQTMADGKQKTGRVADDQEFEDADLGAHLLNNLSGAILGAGNAVSKILSKFSALGDLNVFGALKAGLLQSHKGSFQAHGGIISSLDTPITCFI